MKSARRWLAALLVAVALGGGTWIGACDNVQPPPATLPEPNSPAAKLFVDNCARCHGLQAFGEAGPTLLGTGVTTDKARSAITDGVALKMPAFKGILTEQDIATLTDYSVLLGALPPPTTAPH